MKNNKQGSQYLVSEWIARADDDLLNAQSIFKHKDGTPVAVCFLSQQAAEKYLKALLLFYSGDYLKTHDLNQLATLIKAYNESILNELSEELILLSPYYIATRYPADIPLESFTWEMAEEAISAVLKIKDFMIKWIAG